MTEVSERIVLLEKGKIVRDIKTDSKTLKELEERGAVEINQHIPDISREFVANQNEEDLKRELLFEFDPLIIVLSGSNDSFLFGDCCVVAPKT